MLHCLGFGRDILCSRMSMTCDREQTFDSTPGECCLVPDRGVAYDTVTGEGCRACFSKEGGRREERREGRKEYFVLQQHQYSGP